MAEPQHASRGTLKQLKYNSDRAKVDFCDVRQYDADSEYDVVTLQNNIYYFPVDERVKLFQHLRSFLKSGGKLLVTTGCRDGSTMMRVLDLWSAATEG